MCLSILRMIFLLVLAGLTCASAQESKGGRLRAPVAKDAVFKAVRGQPLEILLEGTTSTSRGLVFAVRQGPRLGSFSEKAPVAVKGQESEKGRSYASLHYTADASLKGDRDTFTFSCKLDGGPSSNEATVTILLSDASPKLKVPAKLDLGRVILGAVSGKSFTVSNEGTCAFSAPVAAPAGFTWRSPAGGMFEIEPGASVEAALLLDTGKARSVDSVLTFMAGVEVKCSARIVPLFSVLPSATLQLQWRPETLTRSARVSLQNNTDGPLVVDILGSPGTRLPRSLSLDPSAAQPLDIVTTEPLTAGASGTITVSSGLQQEVIPFTAAQAPALIKAVDFPESGVIDFGKLATIDAGEAVRTVLLQNKGGSHGEVSIKPALKYFRVSAAELRDGVAVIKAGGELQLTFQPSSLPSNAREEDITLSAPGWAAGLKLLAAWDAALIPAATRSAAEIALLQEKPLTPTRAGPTKREVEINSILGWKGGVIADGTEDPALPTIDTVTIDHQTDSTATFSWELPPGEGWTFRLMRAEVHRPGPDTPLRKLWMPYDAATVTIEGRRASTTVSGLIPGAGVNFAVQTISPNGKKSYPGTYIPIVTLMSPPIRWEYWAMGVLALLGMGYWLRKKWKEPIRVTR